jgi:hypothetical protein
MASIPLVLTLGLGRVAFGAAVYAKPDVLNTTGGMPAATTPDGAYVVRLAGARDVALGLLTLAPRTRRAGILAGFVVDAFDTVSGIAGAREGMTKSTAGVSTGAAAVFAGLGAAALVRS